MILFFRTSTNTVIATEANRELSAEDTRKLCWLFGEATVEKEENLTGYFIGRGNHPEHGPDRNPPH